MQSDFSRTNWIWTQTPESEDRTKPVIVYFRKEFTPDSDFTGNLKISANCRYKLYINGRFVQEGPQKGHIEAAYKDPACIRPYMKEGTNVAAVQVLYYPEDAAQRNDSLYYSPFPCLYVEDLPCASDGWKYAAASHIRITGEPFVPAPIHGSEIVNGDPAFAGWMDPGFDDSRWQDAKPYTFFDVQKPVAPFNLLDRTIPAMEHHPAVFKEVVCVRESAAQTHESLQEQWTKMLAEETGDGSLSPLPEYSEKGDREPSPVSSIEIPANTTQIVEISAGEEMCGYPILALAGGRDARIEILYSESYGVAQEPVMTPMGLRNLPPIKKDRTDYVNGILFGPSDIYTAGGYGTREKPELYEPFLFRTFRYIQIKVSTHDQGMSILRYSYRTTGYPLEVKTDLTFSDETMNKIWDISLRSLKRCMHETYVDCPFYEQLQYTMDSRAEMLFTYAVSGDDRLARQCIESFRRTQRSDGILQASAPAQGVNVIPGFSIFYILMLHDHMMYFGDKALIRDHFGCMDRVLEFFRNHLTEKGLVGDVGGILFEAPYWSFIDWTAEWDNTIGVPSAKKLGDHSITMESMLYLYGLKKAAGLADYIGRTGVAEEYRKRAQDLSSAILRWCVDKDGLFLDGPGLRPEADVVCAPYYSTHCQVWAVLNDLVSPETGRRNLERTLWKKGVPQCSVSMSFYLLEALHKLDWMEKADALWDPWRTMIQNNMTTCAENFTDQRSDCHAWGAALLYAAPAFYLGIRPTSPGFAAWEQKPSLGHLSWIHGQVQIGGKENSETILL